LLYLDINSFVDIAPHLITALGLQSRSEVRDKAFTEKGMSNIEIKTNTGINKYAPDNFEWKYGR
jgi:hypothetical protein